MKIALVSRDGEKITDPGGQDSPLAIRRLDRELRRKTGCLLCRYDS